MRTDPYERFMAKVDRTPDGCWLWNACQQYGYGVFSVGRKNYKAHRWLYEYLYGPVDKELHLDHLCRVKHCVRPDHLDPVPARVNNERTAGFRPTKTHCPEGHPYETYGRIQNGYPVCRVCDAKRHKDARRRIKEMV